jgi:mannose-1-phosphate guanylyltransferase
VSEVRALLLAAGLGTRLQPLTETCPKCLVPIGSRPLLESWLCSLHGCDISSVWVNMHHHREMVDAFLSREPFLGWVHGVVEEDLLGTAGTLRHNAKHLADSTTFLAHADNWCQCDFNEFLDFHLHCRPAGTVMTMMTFRTNLPENCGIIEVDHQGVVESFLEKPDRPPGNLANGAVYLLEPEVVEWVCESPSVTDFSTEVIPAFLGRIASWENLGIHRDIGTLSSLLAAQNDPSPQPCWPDVDLWTEAYFEHPVHEYLANAERSQ